MYPLSAQNLRVRRAAALATCSVASGRDGSPCCQKTKRALGPSWDRLRQHGFYASNACWRAGVLALALSVPSMLMLCACVQSSRIEPLGLDAALDHITVVRPHSIYALLSSLDQLAADFGGVQVGGCTWLMSERASGVGTRLHRLL